MPALVLSNHMTWLGCVSLQIALQPSPANVNVGKDNLTVVLWGLHQEAWEVPSTLLVIQQALSSCSSSSLLLIVSREGYS